MTSLEHHSPVSSERVEEMLAAIPRYADGLVRSAGWVGSVPSPDLYSILTELLALRKRNAELVEALQAGARSDTNPKSWGQWEREQQEREGK